MTINKKLQCAQCQWISSTLSEDVLFRLYIPPGLRNSISLTELLAYNSRTILQGSNAVWCGRCNTNTKKVDTRESSSDIILLEIIRVTNKSEDPRHPTWSKNSIQITFPVSDVILFGSRKYNLAGTCHHRGSLKCGHWLTKLCLNDGSWYELDDLKPKHFKSPPPGSSDSTVVVLLFLAADKLSNSTL